MTPPLEMDRVGLRFGAAAERLADLSLRLAPGMVATVTGPAGAGKTLLIELAAMARMPSRGDLRLFGRATGGMGAGERARARRRIGWAAAEPRMANAADPVDEVALPLRLVGMRRVAARERAAELLDWLGGTGEAGGGEARHRIALARAVVTDQELVLVDEVAAFPPALRGRLPALVARLADRGVACLLASRDASALAELPGAARWRLTGGRLVRAEREPAAAR